MESEIIFERFTTKKGQVHAQKLKAALSNEEKTKNLIHNLETLRSKGEIEEQQYQTMKEEYNTKVKITEEEIVNIRKSIESEIDELNKDMMAYSKDLNNLNIRLQIGEVAEKDVSKSQKELENKVKRATNEKVELERLLKMEKSEYIDVSISNEIKVPIKMGDDNSQKRNKLIFAISGAIAAFLVGMVLSYITFTIGENMIISSFNNGGVLGSIGGSLAEGILNNYSLQLSGMLYFLSHGISIEIGSMGYSESANIFTLMSYPNSGGLILLLLLPFISLLIGGYISAKGANGLVSGIRSGAYVTLPYTLIMLLASFIFSINISLVYVNISIGFDIISIIFCSLITGVLFGGIGGSLRGILNR